MKSNKKMLRVKARANYKDRKWEINTEKERKWEKKKNNM